MNKCEVDELSWSLDQRIVDGDGITVPLEKSKALPTTSRRPLVGRQIREVAGLFARVWISWPDSQVLGFRRGSAGWIVCQLFAVGRLLEV